MPLADLDDYRAALGEGSEIVGVTVATTTAVAGRPYDLWRTMVPLDPAGAPTTAVVTNRSTVGALGQQDGGSGTLAIVAARYNALNPGVLLICDRLVHHGGMSGNTAGAQTTNLPNLPPISTPALTRYTSGDGVLLGLTIYTQIGTTARAVTATYTNQAGTGSRVTPSVQMGATGFREANRMILLPLQEGDTGVRSVQSVALDVGTGTAGNFGVTLFRPLFMLALESTSGVAANGFVSGGTSGLIPEIVDDACLFPLAISGGTNAMGSGALILTEH